MKFLRENMFLIILVAVVLLGGGGMVAAYIKASGDVDKGVQMRVQLVTQLRGLGSHGANSRMVQQAEEALLNIEKAAKEVQTMCVNWNRRNYQVLQLRIPDTEETVQAFPYDRERYRDHGLGYVFSRTYVQAMQNLLNGLNPTSPPTQAEIDSQRLQWENQLMLQRTMEQGASPGFPSGGGSPTPPSVPGVPRGWSGASSGLPADLTEQALEMGRQSAMLNKAKAGEIYVDPNAMDMVFRDAVMNPTVEQLWQAQLNLWVTADIVAAIKATNNEAFASSDAQGKLHNVLTGAVKRLVQVRVNETYVRPAAGEAAAVAVPARGYSEEVPDVGGSDMSGRSAVAGAEGSEQADPLTGRGSSKEYDVLHYRFSVVMPTRYLPALQRNLMAQNYHTILKVDFYTPGAAGAGYGAASPEASGVASSYYYGVEPVVQVDITGELLLLTTWERGAPEAQGEEIQFPPLMPVEVLATQFSGPNNAALREVDISRMPQTTAEPGAAELEY